VSHYADPRIPPRDDVVLRYVLDRFAAERADAVFAVFRDGSTWSWSELRTGARRVAAGLRAAGVRQGDHVATFLPNGPEAALAWYGINYLGAVYVPLNPAYRGRLLEHTVDTSDAELVIAHAELAGRLCDIDRARLRHAVLLGGDAADAGLEVSTWEELTGHGDDPGEPERPIEPWHDQAVWYTSGTTGPSKGVMSSYLHSYTMFGPTTWPFVTARDRWLVNLPLFHLGGCGLWNAMLLRGGSVAFIEKFRTSDFWPAVRDMEATACFLLGTMAAFLESQDPAPDDADHPMRLMFQVPVVDDVPAFAARFGVEVRSVYNMTEVNMPIYTGPTPSLPGTCGRVREGCEVRLVDDDDLEVPVGEVGEFVVRADTPWTMNHGYYKNPEATASAWRNGWFHTGDMGRRDADGNFFFVDRKKDAVRRRGEFISSLELEIELCAHPAVASAAVIGIPNEYAEEDVMAVLQLTDGQALEQQELIDWLRPRVAHFMLPRYIRVVEAFPMTPTEKIRKTVLREDGVTADTFDCVAAGISFRPEAIGSRR
jgi:carnitine-CoA ligase